MVTNPYAKVNDIDYLYPDVNATIIEEAVEIVTRGRKGSNISIIDFDQNQNAIDELSDKCSTLAFTRRSLHKVFSWAKRIVNSMYSLNDIFTDVTNGTLSLPNVQRDFVWKPHQVENLWDSLLRGYPVGSIVQTKNKDMSENQKNEKGCYELLDGQQRITAICIGMQGNKNHQAEKADGYKYLKAVATHYRLFIDMAKPESSDNRKYVFRLITRSHPWGYQRRDNTKTLESHQKNKMLEKVKEKVNKNDFWKENQLANFWPYDARCPVPIDAFMTDNKEELSKWYRKGTKEVEKLNSEIVKKNNEKPSHVPLIQLYRIEDISELLKDLMEKKIIPVLQFDLPEKEKSTTEDKKNETENKAEDEIEKDEIENMFVRLNSAGTPLSGEDLNYSILKAHIDKETIEKIEEACEPLFKPARFITLSYALFKKQRNVRIKPTDFQASIRKKEEQGQTFKTFVVELIESGLLKNIEKLLIYKKDTNKISLPLILAKGISTQAPEVMFMLMYRLKYGNNRNNGDVIKIGTETHQRVLGMITLFKWLGKGDQRDYSKLLKNIYPALESLPTDNFWSKQTVQRALIKDDREYDVLIQFHKLNELRTEIKSLIDETNVDRRNGRLDKVKETFKPFIKSIFNNKELLLYAQREYLTTEFDEGLFCLDDTSVPYDWDHIFPNAWDSRKGNCKIQDFLRDWYNTNGNFWACSFEFNRSVHDLPPCIKFKKRDKPEQLDYDDDLLKWAFCRTHAHFEGNYNIKSYLKDCHFIDNIEKSLCKEGEEPNWWIKTEAKKWFKKPENQKSIYNFIQVRNYRIVYEWYDNLKIDSLWTITPSDDPKLLKKFDSVFGLSSFTTDQYDKADLEKIGYDESMSGKIWEIGNLQHLFFFIAYYDTPLRNDGIEFGIYDKNENKNETLSSVKTKIGRGQTKDWIYSLFTLISTDDNSIKTLVHEIADWLKKFREAVPSGHDLASIDLRETFLKDIPEDYHPSDS
jgi:hypothetical protein